MEKRQRVPAQPWVQNVLTRLLGMRGANVPQTFEEMIQAGFDVSRRDPELLREMGFVPWATVFDQPAVAAQFSACEFIVPSGIIVVVEGWAQANPAAGFNIWSGWSTAAMQAPIFLNSVFARDNRISTVALGAPPTVQCQSATLLASPAAGSGMSVSANGAVARETGFFPVVIGGPSIAPAATYKIVMRLANTALQVTAWGYSLRVVP